MPASSWTPPPSWPSPPSPGWSPPAGWQPDPSWGPPPAGWNFYPTTSKNWFARHKVWTAVGVLVLLVGIGSAIGGGGKGSNNVAVSSSDTAQPTATRSATPSPSPSKPQSVLDRVRGALGSHVSSDLAVGDSNVRSVSRSGQLLSIVLATPSGGFQGPSTHDADALASAALAKAYLAGWTGATWVEFDGGLVDRATGKDLPNAEAFAYRVESREAKQIDWSKKDALFSIDWSIYRAFCHPAFKGC